jgi:hypothetical protein
MEVAWHEVPNVWKEELAKLSVRVPLVSCFPSLAPLTEM